jgi:hypothetical protein
VAVLLLPEDADAGEGAQEAIQRTGVGSGGHGQVVAGARAVGQEVGDPEYSGDVDRLGHLVAIDQAPQHHRRPQGIVIHRPPPCQEGVQYTGANSAARTPCS